MVTLRVYANAPEIQPDAGDTNALNVNQEKMFNPDVPRQCAPGALTYPSQAKCRRLCLRTSPMQQRQ
jgi:hypothetical protein